VFERFWRGRPDEAGTGLGLPIARHIALAHGGDLTVTSPAAAGDGCAFRLTMRTAADGAGRRAELPSAG
jgi:signal transduction histidine kinase